MTSSHRQQALITDRIVRRIAVVVFRTSGMPDPSNLLVLDVQARSNELTNLLLDLLAMCLCIAAGDGTLPVMYVEARLAMEAFSGRRSRTGFPRFALGALPRLHLDEIEYVESILRLDVMALEVFKKTLDIVGEVGSGAFAG